MRARCSTLENGQNIFLKAWLWYLAVCLPYSISELFNLLPDSNYRKNKYYFGVQCAHGVRSFHLCRCIRGFNLSCNFPKLPDEFGNELSLSGVFPKLPD